MNLKLKLAKMLSLLKMNPNSNLSLMLLQKLKINKKLLRLQKSLLSLSPLKMPNQLKMNPKLLRKSKMNKKRLLMPPKSPLSRLTKSLPL